MKNKIIIISTLLAGLFFLSSCLKDDADYWKDDVAGKMYATIEFPGFQAKSLLPVPDEVSVKFLVNIASDAKPSTATTLELAFDNDAISAYDSTLKQKAIENGDTTDTGELIWKDYKPFPGAVLSTPTITIPAGSRNAWVEFKVSRADTVKLDGNYMVAVSLISASGNMPIAANMKTILVGLPIANQYEGEYASEGFRNHPTAGMQPFKYAKLKFVTINANTVRKDRTANYTGYTLDIVVKDETMVVAGVTVNKCDLIIREGGLPIDIIMYSDYNGEPMNYYNPITKVFELYYGYNTSAPRKCRETNSRI